MKEFFINNIVPIITAGIAGTIVKLVYPIGDAAIQLLNKKKEQIEQAIKASGHEEYVKTGWETWNEINEKWRITDKVETLLISKGDEFINLMKKKIPGLSDNEIISIRQAIAGEVNKGKAVILTQTDALKQLQGINITLQTENASLKDQLSKVQSLVTVNTAQENVVNNTQNNAATETVVKDFAGTPSGVTQI